MNCKATELRENVFACKACTHVAEFCRPKRGKPFSKFPPIIGAQNQADLLFVGINPRISRTNEDLHDWLMSSAQAFDRLAKNEQQDGEPYISPDGDEGHYHCHMLVVEGVFSGRPRFESVAAVTELFLCASQNTPSEFGKGKSPCAERYLAQVMAITRPRVVVAVGAWVFGHLIRHFKHVIPGPIIQMVHPRGLHGKQPWAKRRELKTTIAEVYEAIRRTEVI